MQHMTWGRISTFGSIPVVRLTVRYQPVPAGLRSHRIEPRARHWAPRLARVLLVPVLMHFEPLCSTRGGALTHFDAPSPIPRLPGVHC